MGNHEELMRDFSKGIYAGFCEKQASAEAEGAKDNNEDIEEEDKKVMQMIKAKSLGEKTPSLS